FVLAAIPAAFTLALDCYGDALEARCGGLRPLVAAGGLLLLVLSAAPPSPAAAGGVPRLSLSPRGLSLSPPSRPLPPLPPTAPPRGPPGVPAEEPEEERLAA